MSLKQFLNSPDVRASFREHFPDLRLQSKTELLAPPKTTNHMLVGSAFDYLMRFYLKRVNRNAIESTWFAELALDTLDEERNRDLYLKARENLERAKGNYARFLRYGRVGDALARSALQLAQLDDLFRGSEITPTLADVNTKDVADLRKLASFLRPPIFKARRLCILNPTFGDASALVGGADADFIVDDMLVDIKTTKTLEFKRDWYNQLAGYYVLYRLGGIDGFPRRSEIKRLGIYYSRHVSCHVIDVRNIVDEQRFPEFLKWFIRRARMDYGE